MSLLPVPGTIPPRANPLVPDAPAAACFKPPRLKPPFNKLPSPLPILNAVSVANIGNNGLNAEVKRITVLAIEIKVSAKNLKELESTNSEINAPNS